MFFFGQKLGENETAENRYKLGKYIEFELIINSTINIFEVELDECWASPNALGKIENINSILINF